MRSEYLFVREEEGGDVIASPGIDPGYIRLPQTKIIMYKNIWCTAVMWKCCKNSSSAPGQSDGPYPPAVWALSLFKQTFWRLTLSTLECCHMDLWSAQLVLTHHHRHHLHPSLLHQHLKSSVSNSFILSVVFFSGGLPFALFSVKQRAAFQLSHFE